MDTNSTYHGYASATCESEDHIMGYNTLRHLRRTMSTAAATTTARTPRKGSYDQAVG